MARYRAGRALGALVAAAAVVWASAPTPAQETAGGAGAAGTAAGGGVVGVEVNKLEQVEGDCRAYLVLTNRTAHDFGQLTLDLVLFDGEGIIADRLAVDVAPLPTGRTLVKAFDVADASCERIGAVLLNGVTACGDADGTTLTGCDAVTELTSKGGIQIRG